MFIVNDPMFGRTAIQAAQQLYLSYLAVGTATDGLSHDVRILTKYREYVEGIQANVLNDEQKSFLGQDFDSVLNICNIIVEVPADRLKIQDIRLGDADDDPEFSEAVTEAFRRVWDRNRLDNLTADLHWLAGRDGESFLITEYDPVRGVVVTCHELYDGTHGVYGVYSDDDISTPQYFVKRWQEQPLPTTFQQKDRTTIKRMNVYWPDRVEKWVMGYQGATLGWQPYTADGTAIYDVVIPDQGRYEAAVVWWTSDGTPTGDPLGFPVFHFRANSNGAAYGRSDLNDIVPSLQDNLNRAFAMMTAAEQLAGVPLTFVSGTQVPATLPFFPGAIIGLPTDGSVSQVAAAPLKQLIDAVDAKIRWAATLTKVPLSYFNITGQVMAEGTQQQAELPLIAKVERRQLSFGAQYETFARMVIRLLMTFDTALQLPATGVAYDSEGVAVSVIWYPAEIRNQAVDLDRAVRAYSELDLPLEYAWEALGISIEDIQRYKALRDEDRMMQLDTELARQQTSAMGLLNLLGNQPQGRGEPDLGSIDGN